MKKVVIESIPLRLCESVVSGRVALRLAFPSGAEADSAARSTDTCGSSWTRSSLLPPGAPVRSCELLKKQPEFFQAARRKAWVKQPSFVNVLFYHCCHCHLPCMDRLPSQTFPTDDCAASSLAEAESTLDAQAQTQQSNGTCCCEKECSHWTQATPKEFLMFWNHSFFSPFNRPLMVRHFRMTASMDTGTTESGCTSPTSRYRPPGRR